MENSNKMKPKKKEIPGEKTQKLFQLFCCRAILALFWAKIVIFENHLLFSLFCKDPYFNWSFGPRISVIGQKGYLENIWKEKTNQKKENHCYYIH